MTKQIIDYMVKVNRPVDICEACEVIRQPWTVASYAFKKLVEARIIAPLPQMHPTYQLIVRPGN